MKHLVIPDCQIRPGDNVEFLRCIGRYIVKKQPDVIINLGDFADMCSLSTYDQGKRSFEGRRYIADYASARSAMAALLQPINEYNEQQYRNKKKQYKYVFIFCKSIRAIKDNKKLRGFTKNTLRWVWAFI